MASTQPSVKRDGVRKFFVEKWKVQDEALDGFLGKLEQLHSKKLWHQLTQMCLDMMKLPILKEKKRLMDLYKYFVADFEMKMNQLALVRFVAEASSQISDPNEVIAFLEKTEGKIKNNQEALLLCRVLIGHVQLKKGDQAKTKELVAKLEKDIDDYDGVSAAHGPFYQLASDLYRLQGRHAEYYRAALRYLGCTDLNDLTEDEKKKRAFYLGLAALLGDGVYNFGELLAHPILESLKGTEEEWVIDLLYAFNSGSLDKFEKLKPKWSLQPDLKSKALNLKQKICLLCLMEMTFRRPANARQITFAEIADETRLPLEEVELLVMKALALGLVRGSVDQVSANVNMTWVQPRVLDKAQLANMVERLDHWCGDIAKLEGLIQKKAQDILTY
jgi:26S proteasome regulatory subunit N9